MYKRLMVQRKMFFVFKYWGEGGGSKRYSAPLPSPSEHWGGEGWLPPSFPASPYLSLSLSQKEPLLSVMNECGLFFILPSLWAYTQCKDYGYRMTL